MTFARIQRYSAPAREETLTTNVLLVSTTCANAREADELADALVGAGIAACVNAIGGIRATYRWQGEIARGEETWVLIKTTAECYLAVEEAIRSRSSYELPEIIAVPIERGSEAFLNWVRDSTHT